MFIIFVILFFVIVFTITLGVAIGNIPIAFFITIFLLLALIESFRKCKRERPDTIIRRESYNRRNAGNFTGGVEVKNTKTGKYQY